MSSPRPPFPFLVGSERSGTTLFRMMLDAHPDMAVPPESYFIVDLYRRRKRYEPEDGQRYNTIAVANDLAGSRWLRAWGMPPKELARAMRREDGVDFAEAMRKVYRGYARMHGKDRCGAGRAKRRAVVGGDARGVGNAVGARGRRAVAAPGQPGARGGNRARRRPVRRGPVRGPGGGSGTGTPSAGGVLRSAVGRRRAAICGTRAVAGSGGVAGHPRERRQRAEDDAGLAFADVARGLEVVEAIAGDVLTEMGYERAVPDPSPAAHSKAKVIVGEREEYLRRKKRRGRLRRWLAGIRPGRSQPAD